MLIYFDDHNGLPCIYFDHDGSYYIKVEGSDLQSCSKIPVSAKMWDKSGKDYAYAYERVAQLVSGNLLTIRYAKEGLALWKEIGIARWFHRTTIEKCMVEITGREFNKQ